MTDTFFKHFLVGNRYDKDNHRKDQFAYICPHCGEWTCTYVNNHVGNWLYYCHKCGEATNICSATLTMDKVLEKYPNEDVGDLHESIVNIAYLVFNFLIKELKIKAEPNKKILNTYAYWNKDIFEDITTPPTESK